MDDQNHLPPYVRTAPNRQRSQQQGVAAAAGSGNITSVPSVTPQAQHYTPHHQQPAAQLHTYAIRGSAGSHSITPTQYEYIMNNRQHTSLFPNYPFAESGNITPAQYVMPQGQSHIPPFQHHSLLHTTSIQNVERQNRLQNIDRFSADKFVNDKTKRSDYSTYVDRLSTYDDYPSSALQSPESLAEAGFYYTGSSDCVACYQCGRSLTDWNSHNNPWDMHARWSNQCDFVKQAKGENFITHIKMKYSTTLSSEQMDINQGAQKMAKLEATASPRLPKHLSFTSNDVRLETFRNSSSFIYQTHKDLADAGLFYTGDNDQTKCFQCGGGMHSWEEGDIPLVEHLRWYPSCPYVQKKMDKTIINKLKNLFEEKNELISQKPSHESPAPSITDFTSSVAYCAVADLYSDKIAKIEKAFIYYLDHGNEKPTATQILSTVLDIEDNPVGEIAQSVTVSYAKHMRKISEAEALIQKKEDTRKNKLQEVKESIKTTFLLSQCILAEKEASDRQSQVLMDEAFARELENEHTVASPINNKLPNETTPQRQEPLAAQSTAPHDIATLQNENKTLKNAQDCSICMENPCDIAFIPCGHVATCRSCADQVVNCPLCRTHIQERIVIRFS